LIMTRKSNSNPSAKSLQEENEALNKEIESLKSEFKCISSRLSLMNLRMATINRTLTQKALKTWQAFHVKAARSLNFLGDEYDDLNAICKDTKHLISCLSTRLSQLSEKVELLAKQIDEAQEYSYSFNVKLLGIPELKPRESAVETTELCVRIFNAIAANTTVRDIDIAH